MITVEKTQRVKLGKLKPYSRNPRQGDIGAIIESLKAHGQYRALVVNVRSGEILAGNHTFRALEQMGADEALVHYVDVDDEQAARIVLVDNRSNDVASYDDAALLELLASLPSLEGTGYEAEDLDELASLLNPDGQTSGDTEPGEPPEEPRTKPGDLWELGEHRVLCGDSTDPLALDRLLNGEQVGLIFTDPPYGMSYRAPSFEVMAGDGLRGDDLMHLVRDALALAAAHRARRVWRNDWRNAGGFEA